ncbi:DUF3122 domain-containing protein [Spirulina major CS-329]|uniref:DUF3122 domain-containing protein n=1 Tax=Spirulina TaxID=1154 RepID=UPI00232E35FB|nr:MULTISPECIES: DUF3122 domain-containing protein [Spirulina]MDB9495273.1 DUF3122 domain-containing protein [Spirulina subsalsa CS-330]MDB9503427.1 DUF3122 domain-containing protein [Spirulina major CS-329]
MNSICFNGFKINPLRWLLAVLRCVSLLAWSPLPTFASVTQIEEYPGQMLYQSRQNLQDQDGNSWQAIAFKRIHPEGSAIVSLRLIGFYGAAKLDRNQPLTLTTSLGQTLTAKDISSEISQDTSTPANVGEYDIKLVLPQLKAEITLQLTLPTIDGESVSLSVPSAAIQEWQTLISR